MRAASWPQTGCGLGTNKPCSVSVTPGEAGAASWCQVSTEEGALRSAAKAPVHVLRMGRHPLGGRDPDSPRRVDCREGGRVPGGRPWDCMRDMCWGHRPRAELAGESASQGPFHLQPRVSRGFCGSETVLLREGRQGRPGR